MFNRLIIIIMCFLFLYGTVVYINPNFIFTKEGTRSFGVGYKNTTILPLWLISIIFAILSYLLIMVYYHYRYNCIFVNY